MVHVAKRQEPLSQLVVQGVTGTDAHAPETGCDGNVIAISAAVDAELEGRWRVDGGQVLDEGTDPLQALPAQHIGDRVEDEVVALPSVTQCVPQIVRVLWVVILEETAQVLRGEERVVVRLDEPLEVVPQRRHREHLGPHSVHQLPSVRVRVLSLHRDAEQWHNNKIDMI